MSTYILMCVHWYLQLVFLLCGDSGCPRQTIHCQLRLHTYKHKLNLRHIYHLCLMMRMCHCSKFNVPFVEIKGVPHYCSSAPIFFFGPSKTVNCLVARCSCAPSTEKCYVHYGLYVVCLFATWL